MAKEDRSPSSWKSSMTFNVIVGLSLLLVPVHGTTEQSVASDEGPAYLGHMSDISDSVPAPLKVGSCKNHSRPHIVFVLADDMGFADASWNNLGVPPEQQPLRDFTPTLTMLAREGVILDHAYATHLCSPSRAALMTGRYPFRYGLHDGNIQPDIAVGLALNERLLPEAMREMGYKTHMVGKWHLGHCNVSYLPTSRGFQSYFGHFVGSMDYFTHTYLWTRQRRTITGFALHNGTEPVRGTAGTHSNDLFADVAQQVINEHDKERPLFLYLPFTAPHSYPEATKNVLDFVKANVLPNASASRQRYAALMVMFDQAIKKVVDTLRRRAMWQNTIFIFTSDNGPNPRFGSSYPLRGKKGMVFEGGVRVPAFISGGSSLLMRRGVRDSRMVHITDWYPTLLSVACGRIIENENLDGVNFGWGLFAGKQSEQLRRSMLYAIRGRKRGTQTCSIKIGAYRHGNMKLIAVGKKKVVRDGWYLDNNARSATPPWARSSSYVIQSVYRDGAKLISSRDGKKWGLFDLSYDSGEQFNLIKYYPDIARKLKVRLLQFCEEESAVSGQRPQQEVVQAAYPKASDKFWTHGWC